MTKRKHITIDEKHRLSLDADNIQIEVLTAIDPTKSPAYDPAKHDAATRYEWRSIGKFFSSLPQALTFLNGYKVRFGEDSTLREVRDELRAFREMVDGLLNGEEANGV